MNDFWNNMIGLTGLIVGLSIALAVFLINRKYMKKNRQLDERQHTISVHARAGGWMVTSALIIIVWAVEIVVEGVTLSFFLLTFLYVGHMTAYGLFAYHHAVNN
ncbi:Protein of unknown function [Halobacillus alkaliphilus]|uniref:Uncharacterized protein n=1 Tax=Halobacillus alkaliphilus TaxID=396056 RepID=A0A1I2M0B1_9BACI|nr:DUF3796 domain-containing protein [Halobacillus alkaliphilus]SFF82826.1 Protein of unknown function [Halobacillus alkaliphilus]